MSGRAAECQRRLSSITDLGIRSPLVIATGGPAPGEGTLCGSALAREELLAALETCISADSPPPEALCFAAAGEVIKVLVGHPDLPPCGAVVFGDGPGPTREP
jgi:hypothetical protein